MSQRITIVLPASLAQLVTREARRRGVAVSDLVRESLEAHVRPSVSPEQELPFVAIGRSGHRHTARDAEEILCREWGDLTLP